MSEKDQEIKELYYWDEFRREALRRQGFNPEVLTNLASNLQEFILNSQEKDPFRMFCQVIDAAKERWKAESEAPFPFSGEWHHFLVPGVILAAMRNSDYHISESDIREGIQRGAQAKISCGFTGVCGGANSIGVIGALVKRTNPLKEEERQEIMQQASRVLWEISKLKNRCCKRSSYITLKEVANYLRENNYFLPQKEFSCPYHEENITCAKEECPFYPYR